ncbi:MAG: HAD family phosphatase [Planctomycetota bacterium]
MAERVASRIPWAVVFDMDGVLVDSAEPHFQSWCKLADEIGSTITREQYRITFGRQNRDVIPLLFGEEFRGRAATLSERKEAIYRDIVRHKPPVFPGVVELIRALHERAVPLAVGSSGPHANIKLILETAGIRHFFAAVVGEEDICRGKPAPDVFIEVSKRLDLPPQRCVVLEDAPAGVQAAKAASMRVVAVLSTHGREAFDPRSLGVAVDGFAESMAALSVEQLVGMVAT